MKRILLIICLFTAAGSYAQDKLTIIGKWKPVLMYDEKVYFDLKKDSLYMPNEVEEGLSEYVKDSINYKMKGFLKDVIGNIYYQFNSDMTFTQGASGMTKETSGTYVIDEVNKTLTTKIEKKIALLDEIRVIEEKFNYKLNNNRIRLEKAGDADGPVIEFEKQ